MLWQSPVEVPPAPRWRPKSRALSLELQGQRVEVVGSLKEARMWRGRGRQSTWWHCRGTRWQERSRSDASGGEGNATRQRRSSELPDLQLKSPWKTTHKLTPNSKLNKGYFANTVWYQTHKGSSSSVNSKAFSVSRLSGSTNCSLPVRLSSSSSLRNTHESLNECNTTSSTCSDDHETGTYLNFIRLVQISGGQKKDTTSLEMAVSVVMAPHQIFVRRACSKMPH